MARRKKRNGSDRGWLLFLALAALGGALFFYWPDLKPRLEQFASRNKRTNSVTETALPPPPANRPVNTNSAPVSEPKPLATNTVVEKRPLEPASKPEPRNVRPVRTIADAQIALTRAGISVGPIDGANGYNMRRALLAWQIHNGLPVSGEFDEETKASLKVEDPLYIDYPVSEQDLKRLMRIPPTWLQKSELERLDYETILELLAEKGRASSEFLKRLNPKVNWTNVVAGTLVKLPRIDPPVVREKAAFVRVHLYSKTLDAFGQRTNLLAHFPCSIASKVEKRPVGMLKVAKAAANPNYLFDPEVFTESAEAKALNRKLVIPPGPNNPVGTAWIGLDKPGYGIHGTPKPEQVGRTESHGCFRLANWNAEHLLQLVWVGMPVIVEP